MQAFLSARRNSARDQGLAAKSKASLTFREK
jgi:hypothetical protein